MQTNVLWPVARPIKDLRGLQGKFFEDSIVIHFGDWFFLERTCDKMSRGEQSIGANDDRRL